MALAIEKNVSQRKEYLLSMVLSRYTWEVLALLMNTGLMLEIQGS